MRYAKITKRAVHTASGSGSETAATLGLADFPGLNASHNTTIFFRAIALTVIDDGSYTKSATAVIDGRLTVSDATYGASEVAALTTGGTIMAVAVAGSELEAVANFNVTTDASSREYIEIEAWAHAGADDS